MRRYVAKIQPLITCIIFSAQRVLTIVSAEVLKGRVPADELIREHAQRPVIDLLRMLTTLYHLRRKVVWSSAHGVTTVVGCMDRPTKVGNLNLAVDANEDVFGLDVAVHDALLVDVRDGEAELSEHHAGLVLGETALLRKVVEELPAGAELGDEPNVVLGRDDLVQLRDVRVVQLAVVVDLAGERGGHGLGDLLYGDASARQTVRAQPHLPVRPCADARS